MKIDDPAFHRDYAPGLMQSHNDGGRPSPRDGHAHDRTVRRAETGIGPIEIAAIASESLGMRLVRCQELGRAVAGHAEIFPSPHVAK